jgi:hypothetical protein
MSILSAEQGLDELSKGNSVKAIEINNQQMFLQSVSTIEQSVKPYLLPELSSYCTAYARHELYLLFEKIGLEYIDYFDTDSIVLSLKRYFELNLVDSKKLGDFKVEHYCTLFYAYSPKCYVMKEQILLDSFADCNFWEFDNSAHIKAKGLPKNMIKTLEQDFESADLLEWMFKSNLKCGSRYMKTKESLNRTGSTLESKIIEKHFSLVNEKRKFANGKSKAWDFDELQQDKIDKKWTLPSKKWSIQRQDNYLRQYFVHHNEEYLESILDNVGIDKNLTIEENYYKIKGVIKSFI